MQTEAAGPWPSIHPANPSAPAIDIFRTASPTHPYPSFGENKNSKFNEEPVSNFLTRTLISRRQVNHRKNVTYLIVKTWKKPIKDAQISAIRALKEFGSEDLPIRAANDIKTKLEGLLGTLDFDFVTSIPCMHSKRDECSSILIGQNISSSTGIPFKQCFKREHRGDHRIRQIIPTAVISDSYQRR